MGIVKKILCVVLSGLADKPVEEFGNKTPLEAAFAPHMDKLAQRGRSGIIRVAAKGMAVGPDAAMMDLLGYDIFRYYAGRGSLEAFTERIAVEDGNAALIVDFAAVGDDGKTIKDRYAGDDLTFQETFLLAEELNAKITLSNATFELKSMIGHRGVLVIRAMHLQLSPRVTNTDPAYGREGLFEVAKEKCDFIVKHAKPMPGYENFKPAQETAALVNEFIAKSRDILLESVVNKNRISQGKLPMNIILVSGAGGPVSRLPPLQECLGMKLGVFVQAPVEKSIASLMGIPVINVPFPTGRTDVDLVLWSKAIAEKIKSFDGFYIHLKNTDEIRGVDDPVKKKVFIEAVDEYFFGRLQPLLETEGVVTAVMSGDFSMSCASKAYVAPLMISGSQIHPDGTLSFSERAAREGFLGEVMGRDLMKLLIKLAKE